MPPPGATSRASLDPSGDQATLVTGSSRDVTICGQPPVTGTIQTCGTPLRLETKAISWPSGEKLGELHDPTRAINFKVLSKSAWFSWVSGVTNYLFLN